MGDGNNLVQTLINNIRFLIEKEQTLFSEYDTLNSYNNPTDENLRNKQTKLTEIQNSIQLRVSLYQEITDKLKVMANSSETISKATIQQLTMLKVIEQQIQDTEEHTIALNSNNDTQKRLLQINNFYGKNYEAQTDLFKTIILLCVPFLILIILKTRGILPATISNLLIGVYIAVASIIIIRKWWDINTRDNMNFDEYGWNYEDPSNSAPSIWKYNKDNLKLSMPFANLMKNLGICVGSTCCGDGMKYSDTKLQCFNGVETNETFISGGLIGSSLNSNEDDEKHDDDITPYKSSIQTASYF